MESFIKDSSWYISEGKNGKSWGFIKTHVNDMVATGTPKFEPNTNCCETQVEMTPVHFATFTFFRIQIKRRTHNDTPVQKLNQGQYIERLAFLRNDAKFNQFCLIIHKLP